jgi:carbonic anhydrase
MPPPGSGGITVGGEHYDLVQFHFHRPSEEEIHGHRQAMVAHLVHKNAKGELAVVAVLIRTGNTNTFLKQVFDHFPPKGTAEASVPGATQFAARYPHDARPVQPLNDRTIAETRD